MFLFTTDLKESRERQWEGLEGEKEGRNYVIITSKIKHNFYKELIF